MEEGMIVLRGKVVSGHGVAGGESRTSPYPAGTISMQIPFFLALGLDLSSFHPATINITTSAYSIEILNPAFHFEKVEWTDLHGPESFDFIHVGLLLGHRRIKAWGYRPTAETKAGHPQPIEVLEVIAPFLPDLHPHSEVFLELDPLEVKAQRNMTHDPESDPRPESEAIFQSQFRAGELDRTISSRRFLLTCVQWLYLPALLIALVVMIVGMILGWGPFLPVLGGTAAILGAVLSLFRKAGGIRDDLAELREERDTMAAAIHASSKENTRRIPG